MDENGCRTCVYIVRVGVGDGEVVDVGVRRQLGGVEDLGVSN